jgi:hypothetical protein
MLGETLAFGVVLTGVGGFGVGYYNPTSGKVKSPSSYQAFLGILIAGLILTVVCIGIYISRGWAAYKAAKNLKGGINTRTLVNGAPGSAFNAQGVPVPPPVQG